MNVGMITGVVLLAGAFIAAAAEMAAQARLGTFGIISAYSTVDALFPAQLAIVQDFVNRHSNPLIWDLVVRSVLVLPGWLIFGVPGSIIAWRSRPDFGMVYDDDDQLPYTTYEDIVAAAEEIDLDDIDDAGSKYTEHEDYDPAGVTALDSLDEYFAEWDPARPEDDPSLPLPPMELPPPDKPEG